MLWDTTGYVCVRETNQDGCVGDSVCIDVTVLDDVWSVEDASKAPSLSAYPNPANDHLYIQVPENLFLEPFTVLNSLGELVHQGNFQGATLELNIQALRAGQYLLITAKSRPLAFQVQR